ncbi:hypothetical protein K9M42_02730, partial [Patescibacteria group bacterium]|nr:hypothetical protein [Patescibacteria group bacterium]
DGWVSDIDAMNTAHGGFSKIIINQSKNTAQALQIAGDTMRRSSVSGDIKKGTGFGRAEQFTPFRTITGRHKNLPYMTAIDKQFGIRGGLRSIEMGLRGQVADIIQTKGRIAASGGMTTLGATGNQYRMSAALAQGANVRYNNIGRKTDVQSYIDRGAGKVYAPVNIRGINISFDNFEQLRSIISNEINNAMNQLTR